MKKTLSAICLLAAMPCLLGSVSAYATTVPDDTNSDSSVASTMSRGPTDAGERHVRLNAVPTTPSAASEVKFRYMDMVSVKRAQGLRRAVIVLGNERQRNSCSPSYRNNVRDDAPEIRRPSQHGRPVVVMRPMT